MSKRIITLLLICLSNTGYLYAQWTEKDSVWLRNILSGKEKLELNPEALKAIRSGTLINTEEPVDPKDLPPAVFMLYGMNKPLPKVKMLGSFQVSSGIRAEARKPSGISFDDMLQQVFMPSARHKRKNAQRWRTQKYYNNYP